MNCLTLTFLIICFNTQLFVTVSVKQYFFFSKEAGHLSYACPKNMLGEREPPKKKEKKKRKKVAEPEEMYVY